MKDDTYLIITSDHGGEYLGKRHGMLRDDNLFVPIFIQGPSIIKNNEIKESLRLIDIAPTIFNFLNLSPSEMWRGRVIKNIYN